MIAKLLLAVAAGGLFAGACYSSPAPNGSCVHDLTVESTCTAGADGGTAQALGLVGYACSGNLRPDQNAKFVQGVPQGIICADQPVVADGETVPATHNYCCTSATTACAYDPVAVCDPGFYAFQCQDVNRPESYNPEIHCGQGVKGTSTVDYCCSGSALPKACGENDALGCAGGLIGWTCPGGDIPKGENLGSNKSRADQYYLLCSMPAPSPNPAYQNYCCYPPAPLPPGGSCVGDLGVPNCPAGKFGFACTGPDTPPENYPPIICSSPGVRGKSSAGYAATLYCCDFE